MRLQDIFSIAGVVLSGGLRKAYWFKNDDGTASILVSMSSSEGSKEKVSELIEEVRKAVEKIGEKVTNGDNGQVSYNSFLGAGSDRSKLEAVGMATLRCNKAIEKRLCMMNLMQVN